MRLEVDCSVAEGCHLQAVVRHEDAYRWKAHKVDCRHICRVAQSGAVIVCPSPGSCVHCVIVLVSLQKSHVYQVVLMGCYRRLLDRGRAGDETVRSLRADQMTSCVAVMEAACYD